MREDLTLRVSRAGAGLEVEFAGQAPLRFVALATDRFTARGLDCELRVRGDALVFVQNGAEIECPRVP